MRSTWDAAGATKYRSGGSDLIDGDQQVSGKLIQNPQTLLLSSLGRRPPLENTANALKTKHVLLICSLQQTEINLPSLHLSHSARAASGGTPEGIEHEQAEPLLTNNVAGHQVSFHY